MASAYSTYSNTQSDFKYLNVIINNDTSNNIKAAYDETLTDNILENMQDYQLQISRLKIPTVAIPLMIFETGAYVLSMSKQNLDGSSSFFHSQVVTNDVKTNTFENEPVSNFIFYYNQFLTSINNALGNLYQTVVDNPNYASLFGNDLLKNYPLFRLKPNSSSLELLVPCCNDGVTVSSPFAPFTELGINIYMNNKLFYFMTGFSAQFSSSGFVIDSNPQTVANYRFQLQPYLNSSTVINDAAFYPDEATMYNVVSNEFDCLNLWQTLSRIIITTTVPLESEQIITRNDQGRFNNLSVLTDYEIENTTSAQREYIHFNANGSERFTNFKSTGYLDRFNFKIFFQTKQLQTFELIIAPTFEFSIKILFRRRPAINLLQYTNGKDKLRYF